MPIPKPNENEGQDEFMSRCMSDKIMLSEFPEQEQRAAVCYRQWSRRGGLEGALAERPEMMGGGM